MFSNTISRQFGGRFAINRFQPPTPQEKNLYEPAADLIRLNGERVFQVFNEDGHFGPFDLEFAARRRRFFGLRFNGLAIANVITGMTKPGEVEIVIVVMR